MKRYQELRLYLLCTRMEKPCSQLEIDLPGKNLLAEGYHGYPRIPMDGWAPRIRSRGYRKGRHGGSCEIHVAALIPYTVPTSHRALWPGGCCTAGIVRVGCFILSFGAASLLIVDPLRFSPYALVLFLDHALLPSFFTQFPLINFKADQHIWLGLGRCFFPLRCQLDSWISYSFIIHHFSCLVVTAVANHTCASFCF